MRKYFLLILLCVLSCTVMAQTKNESPNEETPVKVYDNHFDCPDYIFQCAMWIKRNQKSDSVLIYCDRMERYYKEHPKELKVFKGDILAAANRFKYQIVANKSEEEILHYFRKALETCKKHNYDLTYYQNYHELIQYYIKHNMLVRAKNAIDEMYKEAEKTNSPYGLSESSRQMGQFFLRRNQKKHAIDNFRKSVEYSEMRHNITNASECIALSELYTSKNDSSIFFAYKSLERGNGKKDSLTAFIQLAILYGQRNDKPQFVKHYSIAKRLFSDLKGNLHADKMKSVEFYHELLNGNYARAKEIAEECKNPLQKFNMIISYAGATNNHILHLETEAAINQYYDSVIETMNEINLIEMQVAYNDRRKAELLKLENEIQQSKLSEIEKQKSLEKIARERAEIELENERLQNEYFKKEAANNKLERKLGEEQYANLKNQAKMQQLEERRILFIFLSLIGGMALLLIFAVVIAVIHYRQMKKEKAYSVKMEKMNNELTIANESQNRFIQNMSHEIRTPLNAICGFATLLANKDIGPLLTQEERESYAKYIGDNTDLMMALVDDILVMGDIESGKYKKQVTSQYVHKVVDSAMSSIMGRVADGVVLRYDDLLPEDFIFNTDLNRTKQVLLNFLTNACKHTMAGEIVVATDLMDKSGNSIPADTIGSNPTPEILNDVMLRFSVTNSGDPIPKDKAEAIFQRFVKLDDFKQGTGLGLPICREIAKLFNGKVYLDTTYSGNGNRFVFEHALQEV